MTKPFQSSNTRIAKNTLFLYFRTLFTIAVGLYISRAILQILGVEDFGIYNVVGGIVMMFSFINLGMVASTQRFISYELGQNNLKQLQKVFSMAVSIHFILALIIFLFAESLGLWFLNTHMNIPPERMLAANCIYQCSILAFMLTVLSVPYNACIVAHEHMKMYAYVSVADYMLRLLSVIILPFFSYDKLVVYGVSIFVVALIIRIIYGLYCRFNFLECRYHLVKDKKIFSEMFSFAGWSFIGNMGFSVKDQGINVLINMFFGATMNAARGIAFQASSVVSSFTANFQMAMNPQITKRYASGDIESMFNLVFRGAKYSFFLLMIIIIPFYIRAPYILELWLGDVPDYTLLFLRLVLIMLLIDSMANPLVVAMQATGRIRNFQLVISLVMICNLPISYIVLKMGGEAYSVMYVAIATSFIGLLVRLHLLHDLITFDIKCFYRDVLLRNVFVYFLASAFPLYISHYIVDNFVGLLIICGISVIFSFAAIFFIGFQTQERTYLIERIKILLVKID